MKKKNEEWNILKYEKEEWRMKKKIEEWKRMKNEKIK